jgi:putative spermidine/putrescine transport system substrate-binding protein
MFDQDIADLTIEFGSLSRKQSDTVNSDIVVADPVEGLCPAMNVACITQGARNQVLAEEWINLHLSEPCMQAYMREAYYSPTVKNVAISDDFKDKLLTPEQIGRMPAFDWEYVAQQQTAWSSRFNREIAG